MGCKHRSRTPHHEQLANVLRAQIVSAETDETCRLPTERELCGLHQTSRVTVRKALDSLEKEGLIERTPSRGTLTVPRGIRQWKRMRQDQVIHVVTGCYPLIGFPSTIAFYGQIYQGILGRCEEMGYRPVVHTHGVHRTEMPRNLCLPDSETALGIILLGLSHEALLQMYADAGFLVTIIDHWTPNPNVDVVVADCFGEGQIAADFLVRHGHKEMFYIGNRLILGSSPQDEPDADLLLAGFQHGLKLANHSPLPLERIRFCSHRQPLEMIEWFLALKPRPTAGLVFSEPTALGLIDGLKGEGIRCPEDVSIISKSVLDGPRGLTCLRADAYVQGQAAVDCLLSRATEKRSHAVRLAIPSQLDRGRTVAYLL